MEIPDSTEFLQRAATELGLIHYLETNEPPVTRVTRKIVDMALDYQGTILTSAVAGSVAYDNTHHGWVTVGVAIGALAGHDMLRRPIVGARFFFHRIKNPWSPAAQSTARIRRDILAT